MKRRRENESSPALKHTRLSETPPRDAPDTRRAHLHTASSERDSSTVIYLVEKKIPSGQLSLLRRVATRKNICLSPVFDSSVTHVVSALPSYERTEAALNISLPDEVAVVNLQWLTSSFQEGRVLEVTEPYRLTKTRAAVSPTTTITAETKPRPFELPEYECQRSTLLTHHNPQLSGALEQLETYYQYKEDESRALAFRQASCSLKALPWKVTHIDQVSSLPRIGRHSKKIIEEILDLGYSKEVEDCTSSEWFHCMQLFTSVYGCGCATARRWYQQGLRTLNDVTTCDDLTLTDTQTLGLKYYQDISVQIPRTETASITDIIRREAEACFPGTSVEAVGGYRRGKPFSHDVDLLLTHHDTAVTDCLLHTLLARLQTLGMVVHTDVSTGRNTAKNTSRDHANTSGHTFTPDGRHRRVVFDHLDKAFFILKLDNGGVVGGREDTVCHETQELTSEEGPVRAKDDSTIIRRVDLIVSPPDQYPFALVSWTGSKQFNRSMRRYSVKECGMSVTAHGIYSMTEGTFLTASSERDVFSILKLAYLEPWERNC